MAGKNGWFWPRLARVRVRSLEDALFRRNGVGLMNAFVSNDDEEDKSFILIR